MARRISVEIVGDSRSLERAFARSERAATRFSGKISRGGGIGGLAGAFGVTVGAGLLVKGIETAVSAASDLNEEVNKSRVVFGKSASQIQRWSKASATAFGLSQQQALAAAGAFGAMFETSGVAEGNAASMSQTMVKLAADMASFNNQDPGEMLDRLRSGLAGEAEPLRRYGVLLSENRVKQEAYRLGLAQSGATLTEQQKVQARYSLILKDTARQQGDFARTSGGLANQQRTLRANLSNTAAVIGKALLPQVKLVTAQLNKWLENPDNQRLIAERAEKTAIAFGHVGHRVGVAAGWMERLNENAEGFDKSVALALMSPLRLIPKVNDAFESLRDSMRTTSSEAAAMGLTFNSALKESLSLKRIQGSPIGGATAAAKSPAAKTPATAAARGVTVGQRNTWFDAMVARMLGDVQDVPTLRGQIAKLRQIGAVVQERLRVTNDLTRQINLGEVVKDINRQIKGDQQQLLNEAAGRRIKAKDRALELAQKELELQKKIRDKQRRLADEIKATLLERLDRTQTRVDDSRAIRDARERLALARQLGGPHGIQSAREALADAQRRRLRDQVAAMNFRLSGGGARGRGDMQLSAGATITINVHGTDKPEEVARKVAEILQRRGRHTSTQTRGPAAGRGI